MAEVLSQGICTLLWYKISQLALDQILSITDLKFGHVDKKFVRTKNPNIQLWPRLEKTSVWIRSRAAILTEIGQGALVAMLIGSFLAMLLVQQGIEPNPGPNEVRLSSVILIAAVHIVCRTDTLSESDSIVNHLQTEMMLV